MIEVKRIKTPTYFEKEESEKDSRFQKVKIHIAHTGENLNNSVFSKKVLESMSKTLPYCPILGYVKKDTDGESDFGSHEKKYKLTEDGIQVSFGTRAYGFIGEDHDAHFEITGGKEWLVCTGYLWTRFTEVLNIFNKSSAKGQSMEIIDADGFVDDEGRVNFTGATFSGLCILGDNVTPAMIGSTISTEFSKNQFQAMCQKMFKEFSKEKGVEIMSEEEKKEKAEKDAKEKSAKEKDGSKKDSENTSAKDKPKDTKKEDRDKKTYTNASEEDKKENKSEKTKEDAKESNSKESESKVQVESRDKNKAGKKNKTKSQFEISHNEINQKIYSALVEIDSGKNQWSCLVDVFDKHFIVRVYTGEEDTKYFDVLYTVPSDDEIAIGDRTEVFPMYVTKEEKSEIEGNRTKVKELEDQLSELKGYKAQTEMSAKRTLLDNESSRLTSEQIDKIEANFNRMSVEETRKEVAYAIFENEQAEKENMSTATVFTRTVTKGNKKSRYGNEIDAVIRKTKQK